MGTEHMAAAIYTHFSVVLGAFLFAAVLLASAVGALCLVLVLAANNFLVVVFKFFTLSIHVSEEEH